MPLQSRIRSQETRSLWRETRHLDGGTLRILAATKDPFSNSAANVFRLRTSVICKKSNIFPSQKQFYGMQEFDGKFSILLIVRN